jgi:bacteriocin-like protein
MSVNSDQAAKTNGTDEMSDNDLQAVSGGMVRIGGPIPIPIGPPILADPPIDIIPLPIDPLPYDTK